MTAIHIESIEKVMQVKYNQSELENENLIPFTENAEHLARYITLVQMMIDEIFDISPVILLAANRSIHVFKSATRP